MCPANPSTSSISPARLTSREMTFAATAISLSSIENSPVASGWSCSLWRMCWVRVVPRLSMDGVALRSSEVGGDAGQLLGDDQHVDVVRAFVGGHALEVHHVAEALVLVGDAVGA